MTVKQKAKQVAKLLRGERPDYFYLKELFRHLRTELKVVVQQKPKKLPSNSKYTLKAFNRSVLKISFS